MTETAAEALLLEAVTAALHGRRLRWEPLSPALWGELFRLGKQRRALLRAYGILED